MGRNIKYKTEEEKLMARRERQMRYYWKNKEFKRKKALERYYDKRNSNPNL